jgi:hypothetical protein
VRATPPDVCNDRRGDALQGYDGSHLIVRNMTLRLVKYRAPAPPPRSF